MTQAPETHRIVARSIEIIEAFRAICRANGFVEHARQPLVAHHDPSIRFTNSTISVFKPLLATRSTAQRFLVQPALRLRNLDHWRRHGRMSGYGCYFIAMGTLCPPDDLRDLHRQIFELLHARLGIPSACIQFRASTEDADLVATIDGLGVPHALDVYELARFRHRFGMPGVTGRNTNIAIKARGHYVDVANVIEILRGGEPIAVELALGVSMVLAQQEAFAHPILASAAGLAREAGLHELIVLDALGSVVALALEGMRPSSRGRGGNYKAFLRLLAERVGIAEVAEAAERVASGERCLRMHASPPVDAARDRDAREAAEAVTEQVAALRKGSRADVEDDD